MMPIPTLKIGLLSHAELQQLAAIARTAYQQTGQRLSMLDPGLVRKLERCMADASMTDEVIQLQQLAQRLQPNENNLSASEAVKVERYRQYGVRVKYYDRPAA